MTTWLHDSQRRKGRTDDGASWKWDPRGTLMGELSDVSRHSEERCRHYLRLSAFLSYRDLRDLQKRIPATAKSDGRTCAIPRREFGRSLEPGAHLWHL